jgi:transposase
MDEIGFWAGLDWGSVVHRVCLLDATRKVMGERDVSHSGEGLAELCDWLVAKAGTQAGRIAVAIETPHGPVVEALLERGFKVHAINPKQLDRFRDRFSAAGAKDDGRDALVLAHSLSTDLHAFRCLAVGDPVVIELREWSRLTDDLTQERNRLTNRMRDQLWRYYPQALKLTDDLGAEWFLALWHQAPTPVKAAKLRRSTLDRLLKQHRIRRIDAAGLETILREKPLSVAPGTAEAASAHIRILIKRVRLVNEQLREAHRQLDALCQRLQPKTDATNSETSPGQACEQRDVEILSSLPGNGRIVRATLLGEAWEPLQRRDYHVLRTLCAVAPVTKRSGKSLVVLRRRASNKRLERALYHWARVASQRDPTYRQRYADLRAKGHSHGRTLRTVGDHLLYLTCVLLKRQTPYDPNYKTQPAAAAA